MNDTSIGHTGRDLRSPPKLLKPVFILMVLAVIVRVFVPLVDSSIYQWTIIISGSLWVLTFALFVLSYAKILVSPRVDG